VARYLCPFEAFWRIFMKFKTGEFQKYTTATDIVLGDLNGGMTLTAGAEVEFDGATMKWGCQSYHYPKLALGIKAGWVHPYTEGVEAPTHQPQSAGVEVRPAQSTGNERGEPLNVEMAMEDEQVAGTLEASNARRKEAATARATAIPPAVNATPDMGAIHTAVDATPEGMRGNDSLVVDVTPPPGSIDAPVQAARPAPAPAKKKFPVVGAEGSVEEQDGVTVAKIGSAKSKMVLTDVGQADREVRAAENRKPQVQKVAAAPQPQPEPPVAEVADIVLPDPAPEAAPAEFEWDIKGLHWQKRIKLAIEKYGDDPAILKKIVEMETPGVAKALRSHMVRKSAEKAATE
jgi:hypothetical protein